MKRVSLKDSGMLVKRVRLWHVCKTDESWIGDISVSVIQMCHGGFAILVTQASL